jgi:predicted HAD superfamily hydrolase
MNKRTIQTSDISLWQSDKYLNSLANGMIDNISLVSLDIFDTVLFRTCHHPTDVFLTAGQLAKQRGLLPQGITAKEFQQIRILAEQKARAEQKKISGTTEVTLESIYQRMPLRLRSASKLIQIELEVEMKYCYANFNMVSLMHYLVKCNIPIVAISDMYLSATQIELLLSNAGVPINLFTQIIVSNEEGVGKTSGLLFKKLLAYYPDVEPATILHIGDNQVADVEGAKSKGLQALHYNIVPSQFDDVFDWEKIRTGVILPEINSLRKLACATSAEFTPEEQKWFQIGAGVIGPLLTLFSEWVVDICENEGHKAVYPLMREGKLLAQMISKAAHSRNLELEIRPMYISRQAITLISVAEFGREQIEDLFVRNNFSVRNLFELLEIDFLHTVSFSDYMGVFLSDAQDIILQDEITLRENLIDFLLQDGILCQVQELIVRKRELFIKYLQSINSSLNDFVTVDLGFKGTIQKALEATLKQGGVQANLVHLLAMGAEENKYHLFENMDIRGFTGNSGENVDLITTIRRSQEAIEELMMDETGSTVGYVWRKDGTVPVLAKNQCPEIDFKFKKIAWQGILAFQDSWFYLQDAKLHLRSELLSRPREILQVVHRLIDFPTLEEALLLGDLHFEDNWGSNACSSICTQADEQNLRINGPERLLERLYFGFKNGKIRWPQAVVTRSMPNYLLKRHAMGNSVNSYLSIMSGLVSEIQQAGFSQITVYGAGQVGRALIKAATLHQLKVAYVVDRKESLWGQFVDGVEVISLQQAIDKKLNIFAIGSLAFNKEIKGILESAYKKTGIKINIFGVEI